MLYYFAGKETYLKKQELKKIKQSMECPELTVGEYWELSPEAIDFMLSVPFAGDKKVCILNFFPEAEAFSQIANNMPDYLDVYIVSNSFPDMRKKVVKEILSVAQKREFEKISESLLFKCISSRLQRFGFSLAEIEAVKTDLTAAFHGYTMYADMDLDIVIKHVDMIGYTGSLTPENIRAFAPDSTDLRMFLLSSMLLSKDEGCLDFARRLMEQGETGIGMLNLVAYQIRICYKAVLFTEDRNYLSLIGIRNFQLYKGFRQYNPATYKRVYGILITGINRIKKGEKQNGVLSDCLLASLAVLKEESL